MRASALTGVAAAVTAMAVVLSGCGSDSKTATASSSSTVSSAASSSKASTSKKPTVALRDQDAAGRHPTIASYIKDNGITETAVHMGDPRRADDQSPSSRGLGARVVRTPRTGRTARSSSPGPRARSTRRASSLWSPS